MNTTTVDRTGCDAAVHGTLSAYNKYRCKCPDALEAGRLYRQRKNPNYRPARPAADSATARRVQAMWAMGWEPEWIAHRLGWSVDRVHLVAHDKAALVSEADAAAVDELFQQVAYVPGPSAEAREYARQAAFVTAMAWDNVDRDELPCDLRPGGLDNDEVDRVKVDRCVAGRMRADEHTFTRAEKNAVVDRLLAAGRSWSEILDLTGINHKVVLDRRKARASGVAA